MNTAIKQWRFTNRVHPSGKEQNMMKAETNEAVLSIVLTAGWVAMIAAGLSIVPRAAAVLEYTPDASTVALWHANEANQLVTSSGSPLLIDSATSPASEDLTPAIPSGTDSITYGANGLLGGAVGNMVVSSGGAGYLWGFDADFNNTTGFTMEMWFKPSSGTGPSSQTLASRWAQSDGQARAFDLFVHTTNNKVNLFVQDEDDAVTQLVQSNTYDPAIWNHVAFVYDASDNDSVKLFVTPLGDTTANLVASTNLATTINEHFLPGGRFSLLNNFGAVSDRGFRGLLDEVRFSSVARSPSEFTTLIPEPGTMGFLALGAVMILRRRRPR